MNRSMIRNRYRRILWFFGKAILSIIGWDIILPRLGLRALSQSTRKERLRTIAARFRVLAVQMGGVMIKVGQFLSARLDVLPHEITDELSGLQDEVRPEAFEEIRAVIESQMNGTVESLFIQFDPEPLASASIGQVHRAQLRSSENEGALEQVVVKVQRPNIQQIVETDLSALRVVSGWVNLYPPIRRRANVPALLDEFSRSLNEEINYLNEGSNVETFARNFEDQPDILVPRVFWSHTTRQVLTLEEIQAIKITQYERIEEAGISRVDAAQRLLNTYLKQVFEDRFFHADPHPGNLFLLPDGDESTGGWKLVFVDFGMTGVVTPNQLTAMREMMIAIGTGDIPRLIRAYGIMGVLLPGADIPLLEKATQRVFERFWGKSTAEMVNMGQQEAVAFAEEFSELLYDLPFQVPENLILLARSLSILSGICTGLDPDFNIWKSVMPYAKRLIEAENGKGGRGVLVDETLGVLRTLVSLPGRANALLQRIEQGRLEVQIPEMRTQFVRLERRVQRLAGAVVFAALFTGCIQLYLAGSAGLALACAGGAALALLWTLAGR